MSLKGRCNSSRWIGVQPKGFPFLRSKIKGLSSFQSRLLALFLLGALVLPTVSRAENNEKFSAEIISLNSSIRGEILELTAKVNSNKTGLTLNWNLPEGFKIVKGAEIQNCTTQICEKTIEILINSNSSLGPHIVGVKVDGI